MSSTPIQQAKLRLPLPTLMQKLGLGDHARKSALCPFHEDTHNSFSVWKKNSAWFWKCHSGCGGGDEINFLESHKGISRSDAIKLFLQIASVNGCAPQPSPSQRQPSNGEKPFDWQQCVSALKPKELVRLANERWYSRAFCSWLHKNKLVGLRNGCVAFPVHDEAGTVTGAHYRKEDSSWRYTPTGTKTRPLIIGDLATAKQIYISESQWDAFALADRTDFYQTEGVAFIATRGASNAALVKGLIPQSVSVLAWPQNDKAGEKWLADFCAHAGVPVAKAVVPAPHKDVNDWTKAGASAEDILAAMFSNELVEPSSAAEAAPPLLIEFKTPSQLKSFIPPPGIVLAGDCHIVRGSVFVIGGAPGVGKSRASVALAEAGATGHEWFGLTVHRKFKTMVIQTENGLFRLSKEFGELNCDALEDYVRICPPPPFGLCFQRNEFKAQLSAAIADFAPDVVVFDPWNAAARDEKAREYLETFDALRSVLPLGDNAPALGIVAHTRKPKTDERASGRALLNLLAGSYVLGSVPRTAFVMQAASDDTEDRRIVWTCCKNNDGELGSRSAWERRNGLFVPVTEFDWEAFDAPDDGRETLSESDLAAIFENGALTKAEAVKELTCNTGASRASCYRALKKGGRFAKHLRFEAGKMRWHD